MTHLPYRIAHATEELANAPAFSAPLGGECEGVSAIYRLLVAVFQVVVDQRPRGRILRVNHFAVSRNGWR